MRVALLLILATLAMAATATAQDLSGTYVLDNEDGSQTVLALQESAAGLTGSLSGNGTVLTLQGVRQGDVAIGVLSGAGGEVWFEVQQQGGELYLILVAAGADGQPDLEQAATLVFSRSDAATAAPGGGEAGPAAKAPAVSPPAATAAGEPHDGTDLGKRWYQFLAGQQATKMERYSSGLDGGYTARTDVHLCPDGSFLGTSESSVSMDVGGAFGNSSGNESQGGRWRIITQAGVAGVELAYDGGGVEQVRLELRDGATFVNGTRWYITPSEVCPRR